MKNHPHINVLYDLFDLENQPFRKVHRMIDLFESLIKYHTAIIMAEYFRSNNISDNVKRLFVKSLERPSLGYWQNISRILHKELEELNHDWFIYSFKEEFLILENLLNQAETNAINFRNKYAHGATPSDNKCREDIARFFPLLNKLLKFEWLLNSEISIQSEKVWVKDIKTNGSLCLFPILVYRYEVDFKSNISFYNDIKSKKINLLNYPYSNFSECNPSEKAEFYQTIPLTTWMGNYSKIPSEQKIIELTQSFQGRLEELEALKSFVFNNEKGFFVVHGNPGIGKSSLLAKFSQDVKDENINNSIHVIIFFTKIDSEPFAFLEYLSFWTRKIFGEKYMDLKPMLSDVIQLKENLLNNLRQWSNFRNERKIIFIIDGLDEGIDNGLINFLPFTETFDGILFIYGSRKTGHPSLEKLFTNLPPEFYRKITLSGLKNEDIRALIYKVGNKYLIDKDSQWIKSIETLSEGNPLYLRLLCNDISNRIIQINDNTLPGNIEDYFNRIIDRFAYSLDGDKLLLALYTFAASKDYLSMSHIKFINSFGDDALVHRIKNMLIEILNENTKEVKNFQLFHESFRQFLIKEKRTEVKQASDRIIEFCSHWRQYNGLWEQEYALNSYVDHLIEINDSDSNRLIKLLKDEDYINSQKNIFKTYEPTKKLYRKSIRFLNSENNYEKFEVICNLINLRNTEYQEAKEIFKFLNGDIDLLLLRLRMLDGIGKQDKQNLFLMFIICLTDLSIINKNSLNIDHGKIEQLLKLFDELIPNDHSILDWKDFFSERLMFMIADVLKNQNIDYSILFNKISSLSEDWILNLEVVTDSQIDLLLSLAERYPNIKENLTIVLAKNKKYDLAKNMALKCNYPFQTIAKIIQYLADKDPIQAENFMDVLPGSSYVISRLKIVRFYDSKGDKDRSGNLLEIIIQQLKENVKPADYALLAVYFQEKGEIEIKESYFKESVKLIENEENDFFRSSLIEGVIEPFIDLGKYNALIKLNDSIRDDFWKYINYEKYINILLKKNKYDTALNFTENLADDFHKIRFYSFIALSYFNSKQFEEGKDILNRLEENDSKNNLFWIAKTMAENGLCEDAKELISYPLIEQFEKDTWYCSLAKGYAKNNIKEKSIECLKNIKNTDKVGESLKNILNHIASNNQFDDLKNYILDCFIRFDIDNQEIKKELIKKHTISENNLVNEPDNNLLFNDFIFDELIHEFNNSDIEEKSKIWLKFLTIPLTDDQILKLKDYLILYLVSINDGRHRISYLMRKILPLFILNGHKDFTFYIIENYIFEFIEKLHLYLEFSIEYIHILNEVSIEFLEKAVTGIENIDERYTEYTKSNLYNKISLAFIKHRKFEVGINYAKQITSGDTRNDCWNNMGKYLINNDSFVSLLNFMSLIPDDEIIYFKNGIIDGLEVEKSSGEMIEMIVPLVLENSDMLDLLMLKYALNLKINDPNNNIFNLLKDKLFSELFWNENEPITTRKTFQNYHSWNEILIDHPYVGVIENFYQSVLNGTLSEESFNDIINSFKLN
jgi:hypothetical protein